MLSRRLGSEEPSLEVKERRLGYSRSLLYIVTWNVQYIFSSKENAFKVIVHPSLEPSLSASLLNLTPFIYAYFNILDKIIDYNTNFTII